MIVMEYMARGSLSDVLNDKSIALSECLRSTMALEAARGLDRMCSLQNVFSIECVFVK